jgi:DNA repair exonuclease SbcCD ATPase subunit
MKIREFLFMVIPVCLVLSCSNGKMEKANVDTLTDTDMVAANQAQLLKNISDLPAPRDLYSSGKMKLIKNLHYRFEVQNVNKCIEAIEVAVKKYPAYISNSKLSLENPILENKLTIRIQSEYFQDLVKDIDTQAKFVNFRNITTEDVAKQFVDLESRLKTKREVEARYMEILRKKAGTIPELLDAEEQIGELHEEIESTIGQLNYLKDQVSYSTIQLEFYQTITQEITSADTPTLGDEFANALAAGWSGVIKVLIIFAYLWPLLLIGSSFGLYFWVLKKSAQ